jgi:uncharacterized damage-inducible protein DinB
MLPTQIDDLGAIREWYRYNSYVRKKYLAALEKLPPGEINRDRGASFPTLIDILAHTLDAYNRWFFYRYLGKNPDSSTRLRGQIKSLQALNEAEKKVDFEVMRFVEGLKPSDLDNTFETIDESNKYRFNLRQMLWHLVEEELQHRGEINALLWQIDIDPPITDWLDWKLETGEIEQPQKVISA